MSVQLSELAKNLGITTKELQKKITELGFELKPRARTIDDELASLLKDELSINDEPAELSKAEEYEEIVSKEIEREIVKKQRKMTAGKDKEAEKLKAAQDKERQAQVQDLGKKTIELPGSITVKEFAEKASISPAKVIGELMKNGILSNINQRIDYETAAIVAGDLGLQIKRKREAALLEDVMTGNLEAMLREDDPADLITRPPIVAVMGHVDHGKTKLLDTIRQANVVAQEAGGITQHIGAYQVEAHGKKITFLDTPGHEAFTAMRARGAKVTDIAIIVVAADEGIKPQTIEAINHVKEAKVPIIVAINKIDKEGANIDRVKGQLAEQELQPEDWGGTVPMVPISALTGEGVDQLLDTILVVAEVAELKANPDRPAVGTVVESNLEPTLGPVATILINAGALRLMDNIVVGQVYGRVKVMLDHTGKRARQVGPSGAVKIAGLSAQPQVGDILQVVANEKMARLRSEEFAAHRFGQTGRGFAMEEIISRIQEGNLKTLKVIVKADTHGSLEAIRQVLSKIKNDNVAIQIIHSGVGNISESDIMMAAASKAIVVGFHNKVNFNVQTMAEREKVEVFVYDIIYKLAEDLTKLLSGLIEPEIVRVDYGKALVKQIFWSKKQEMILGCAVKEGKMLNKAKLEIWRGEEKIGDGQIVTLQRVNEVVSEMKEGTECGIKYSGNIDVAVGDILLAYGVEKKIRTL